MDMSYVILIWTVAAILVSIKRYFEEIEKYNERMKPKFKEKIKEEKYYQMIETQFEFSAIEI